MGVFWSCGTNLLLIPAPKFCSRHLHSRHLPYEASVITDLTLQPISRRPRPQRPLGHPLVAISTNPQNQDTGSFCKPRAPPPDLHLSLVPVKAKRGKLPGTAQPEGSSMWIMQNDFLNLVSWWCHQLGRSRGTPLMIKFQQILYSPVRKDHC